MLCHTHARRRRGAAAIEYAVLLSVIIGGTAVGVSVMSAAARDQFGMGSGAITPGDGSTGGGSSGGGSTGGGSSGGGGSTGGGSTGGGSSGGGSGSAPGSGGTSFHPLHDNFDGKGNDNMAWQDAAGAWETADGARSSADPDAATVAPVGSADYTFHATLQTTASTGPGVADTARVVVRYQDAQNYYAVVTQKDGVVALAKMQNGQWYPALAYAKTKTDPFEANDYQVRASGGEIEVKVNGKTVVRYPDPNPVTSGGVGAANHASAGRMTTAAVTPNNGG